jgi:predicted DNA-binding protein
MELSKKTTILLSPELHTRLTRIASQRGTSLGSLVREACEREYGETTREQRLEAVRALAELNLPVGSPGEMARESVPSPHELLP